MQLTALPLVALALLNAADAPAPAPTPSQPQTAIREFQPEAPLGKQCRDQSLPTKEEPARQPRLEREPATPGVGQIIYAVERRIDGCSVVVVKYDSADTQGSQRPFSDTTRVQTPDSGE
jgi:hypothetical protein